MIYDGCFYNEKPCWGCNNPTKMAIVRHGNEDKAIAMCMACMLELNCSLAGVLSFCVPDEIKRKMEAGE